MFQLHVLILDKERLANKFHNLTYIPSVKVEADFNFEDIMKIAFGMEFNDAHRQKLEYFMNAMTFIQFSWLSLFFADFLKNELIIFNDYTSILNMDKLLKIYSKKKNFQFYKDIYNFIDDFLVDKSKKYIKNTSLIDSNQIESFINSLNELEQRTKEEKFIALNQQYLIHLLIHIKFIE